MNLLTSNIIHKKNWLIIEMHESLTLIRLILAQEGIPLNGLLEI